MEIWNYLNQHFDLSQLIAFAIIFWIFKSMMEKNLEKKFEKIDERFDRVDDRFDKVDDRFEKIEGRLSRLENDMIEVKTILRMKECCMIQDEKQLKKID